MNQQLASLVPGTIKNAFIRREAGERRGSSYQLQEPYRSARHSLCCIYHYVSTSLLISTRGTIFRLISSSRIAGAYTYLLPNDLQDKPWSQITGVSASSPRIHCLLFIVRKGQLFHCLLVSIEFCQSTLLCFQRLQYIPNSNDLNPTSPLS